MEYVYAALLLHKLGQEVNEENIKKVVSASGAEIDESKIKSLVTSLKGVDIDKELQNATLASAPAQGSQSSQEPATEAKEEKEEKKEAAAEGLSALFG